MIEENLDITDLAERARVVQEDVFRFPACQGGQSFESSTLLLQCQGLWARTLQALDRTSHLVAGGLAIAQIFPKEYTLPDLTGLKLVDQRCYGSTLLCFYQSAAIEGGGEG